MKKYLLPILMSTILFNLSACSNIDKSNIKDNDNNIKINEEKNNDNDSNLENKDTDTKPNLEDKNIKNNSEEVKKPDKPEVITYKKGDIGDAIKIIQQRLYAYGYKITVDGEFGEDTYNSIIDFQKRLGLTSDGVVGPTTLKKLNEKPTEKTMYKEIKTNDSNNTIEDFINKEDAISNTSYYMYVDLKQHNVNIFQGYNHNWKLIKTFKITIGASDTPTIKGHFEVGEKGEYFRANSKVICKYYTQISGNYLFHSVLLNNDGEVVDGRLGYNISHGCIRLSIENAKYIYDNIPEGTHIWIK